MLQALAGAVLNVPFLRLWGSAGQDALDEHEQEEWGDPSVPEHAQALEHTCPFTNLRSAR